MVRFVYAILLGLVGATVAHIVILLLVPTYAQHDAWSRLEAKASAFEFVRLDNEDRVGGFAKSADPLFVTAACRFALTSGIAHVWGGEGSVPFWSASVFDRKGQIVFSFNDRTATDRKLDVVVATPVQMVELRKELPEEFSDSVFVETDAREGIVVARVFVPDASWRATTDEFLGRVMCRQK